MKIWPGVFLLFAAAALLPAPVRAESFVPWPSDGELAQQAIAEGKRHAALLSPSSTEPLYKAHSELFLKQYWRNADEHTQKSPVRVETLPETDERYLAGWWGVEGGRFAYRISAGLLRFVSEVAKSYELGRISQDPDQRPKEASFHLYYEYLSYVGGGHYVWHAVPAFETLIAIPFPPSAVKGSKDPARDVPKELSSEFLEFIGAMLRTPELADLAARSMREKGFTESNEFKEKVAKIALAPHMVERLRLLAIHQSLPKTLAEPEPRAAFNAMMRNVLRIPDMAYLVAAALTSRGYVQKDEFHERVLALQEPRNIREEFEALLRSEDFPVLFYGWLAELQKAIRDTNQRMISALLAHEIGHLALGYPQKLLRDKGMLLGGHDDPQVASVLRLIEYTENDELALDQWYVEAVGSSDPPGYGLVLLLDALSGAHERMMGTNFRYVFLHPSAKDRVPQLVNLYFKKGQDMAKTKPLAERVVDGYVTRAADLRKLFKK